ncbi:hypothetical protein DUNSADRAFT_16217, partial [Dunaliella salina]
RDCVRQIAGALLEVEVGTREAWRDPKHPLKVGVPPITYLPTLVYWPRSGPSRTLTWQLNSKADRASMEKVVMQFLESTKRAQRLLIKKGIEASDDAVASEHEGRGGSPSMKATEVV